MTKKADWPKGTAVQKVTLNLPTRLVIRGKVRAVHENRTLQELVAQALEDYLRKVKKGVRP
jgi:hypothetical protein